jgi:ApaG protein
MRGKYFIVAVDGERFEADIPAFALDATGHGDGVTPRILH